MFRILIMAHAPLASGTCAAASGILGQDIPVYGLDTNLEQTPEQRLSTMRGMLDELLASGDVLVLVDFLGGTPSNIVLPELGRQGVEIVTGFNLPMVFKAVAMARSGATVGEAARELVSYAPQHIRLISDMLGKATK